MSVSTGSRGILHRCTVLQSRKSTQRNQKILSVSAKLPNLYLHMKNISMKKRIIRWEGHMERTGRLQMHKDF